MACHTNTCCCGCIDQKTGIVIAGIIDIISVFSHFILQRHSNFAFRLLCGSWGWYRTIWCLGHFIGGILLLIGAITKKSGLLTIWLITGMINIVSGILAWIWLLLGCSDAFSWKYIAQIQYAEEYIFHALVVWSLVCPIYYIYLWVVVRSYQRNLAEERPQPNSDTAGEKMMVVLHGQSPEQPPPPYEV